MNWFQVFLEAAGRRSRSGLRARVAWIMHLTPELSEHTLALEFLGVRAEEASLGHLLNLVCHLMCHKQERGRQVKWALTGK